MNQEGHTEQLDKLKKKEAKRCGWYVIRDAVLVSVSESMSSQLFRDLVASLLCRCCSHRGQERANSEYVN